MKRKPIDRRRFLQYSALAGFGAIASSQRLLPFSFPIAIASSPKKFDEAPIAVLEGEFASRQFNGDEVDRPHKILWNLENYIANRGGRPEPSFVNSPVIVGGGMSGLLSAYFLRDLNPLLLEQASRFGGNSKGESFDRTAFSIGAAYITVPEAGSEIDQFLTELQLKAIVRHETEKETRVHLKGAGLKNLWAGETDPSALPSVREVSQELRRIFEEAYPEIPWSPGDPLSFEALSQLDRENAHAWLRRVFRDLHPHLEEYFQLYCFSSFGGALEELSAAQFLNFVSSEVEGILAFPGGNAAIAEAVLQKLRLSLPQNNILAGVTVLEVKSNGGNVDVLYEKKDKLVAVRCPAVVAACPKYVARSIIKQVPESQASVWRSLKYRAYVVANVRLKKPTTGQAYDIFCLEGKVPERSRFGSRTDRAFTDIVVADWANREKGGSDILTIYKPYCYDGARAHLVADFAHDRVKRELEKELPPLLESLGFGNNAVDGIRVTRWGHAVPLAEPGYIADQVLEKISAPVNGRIFFANQDNLMNPAFESCFSAAKEASDAVRVNFH